MYDFSIDYSAIDKSNILNINKYLMLKNNVKNVWNYLKNGYYIIKLLS